MMTTIVTDRGMFVWYYLTEEEKEKIRAKPWFGEKSEPKKEA